MCSVMHVLLLSRLCSVRGLTTKTYDDPSLFVKDVVCSMMKLKTSSGITSWMLLFLLVSQMMHALDRGCKQKSETPAHTTDGQSTPMVLLNLVPFFPFLFKKKNRRHPLYHNTGLASDVSR